MSSIELASTYPKSTYFTSGEQGVDCLYCLIRYLGLEGLEKLMNSKIVNYVFRGLTFLLMVGCISASLEGGIAEAQERSTPAANQGNKADAKQLPLMVRNGLRGPMHEHLDALLGEWQVEMTFYIAGGTKEKPLISRDLTCRRDWITETGNRHMRDVTEGSVGGNRY